jgi:nucleoid-associated protein YgaU
MNRTWARILAGVLVTGVVWVAAYWWLNPRSSDKISFGAGPQVRKQAPTPPPRKVEIVDLERPPLIAKSVRDSDASPPVVAKPVSTVSAAPSAGPGSTIKKEPTPVPAAPKPAVVVPPRFVDYTVQDRDTLTGIAAAKLGSAKHVDAIRRANPLKDLDRLKAGDVIRIPEDPANIQGKPAQGAPPPAPPAARQGEMLEYTVQSGDTLSRIAREKYGSPTYQDLIYNANRDRLASPNSLKEGQKLRLPPKPSR